MYKADFSQPQRQSVKGLVLIFLQEGKRVIQMFWPMIIPVIVSKSSDKKLLIIGLMVLVGLILTLIHAILFYRSFRFHIENQQFILRKGYINRKTLTIPLDRIQNVNTNQTVLQQFLDVMSIEIDTAGSSGKELKIHALTKPMAAQLAMELSAYVVAQQADRQVDEQYSAPKEELVLKLTNCDLLRIGISQNHLRTAVLIFILGIQFYNQIKDYFKVKAEQYATEAYQYISESGWAIIVSLILFFLLISLLYSMVRTLIRFYDLRFLKQNKAYRIVSGLLNRKNVLIPFSKIQQLDWETGPIKKIFGIYEVKILQATSQLSAHEKLIEIPGCLNQHIELLKSDLFGMDELKDQPVIHSSRLYFRRTCMAYGIIPTVLLSPVMLLDWRYGFGLGIWLIANYIYSVLLFRKSSFQISNHQVRVSSGAVTQKYKQMEFHKVQHLEFRQSIFHKKRGVASLKIGNASGFIRLPYIDESIARALHNYLLYYAETSEKFWL